jgi:outer membrane protein OmpA-like peptidoglycan-associated protein
MRRLLSIAVLLALASLPLFAQTNAELTQAQQVLELANSAGAQQYAKSLYDDAAYRIRFAQENMNSPKANMQEQARMRAREASYAARAALAKARWAGTNAAIRNLQSDITRFGGTSDLRLQDEDPNFNYGRGSTTKERIATAQAAIDQARSAGAEQSVADNELKTAQGSLDSANKVSRNGRDNSEVADHLAYVAEMIARRAYYVARFNESARSLPDIQLQRTKLAQTASEQSAAAERAQRLESERRAAELQAQLAAQEANRQSQAAEVERLRQQVDESRRAMAQRIETDRSARLEAERNLDTAMSKYEAAATSGSSDIDTLRRQVEDAEIALRTIQERERLNQEAMSTDINTLRTDIEAAQNANLDPAVLSQRQADLIRRQNDLEQFRKEREADMASRADIQHRHEAAVASALSQRQAAETEAQHMRQQIEAAQAAAQQAALAAQQANESAQKQAEENRLALANAQKLADEQAVQSKAALEDAKKLADQQAAEAAKARAEARRVSEELERTRADLAKQIAEQKAAEDRRRMEAELARLAQTKRESRGLVVTLPGIFFDTGKSVLKPGAKNTLTKIASQLKGSDTVRIAVEGHTDSVGDDAKNQQLSEKRAEAVRDFLLSAGVPADRITASGKGEADPVATNKTTAGRQQNRRVELVISE